MTLFLREKGLWRPVGWPEKDRNSSTETLLMFTLTLVFWILLDQKMCYFKRQHISLGSSKSHKLVFLYPKTKFPPFSLSSIGPTIANDWSLFFVELPSGDSWCLGYEEGGRWGFLRWTLPVGHSHTRWPVRRRAKLYSLNELAKKKVKTKASLLCPQTWKSWRKELGVGVVCLIWPGSKCEKRGGLA